jgi:hypothetical protein
LNNQYIVFTSFANATATATSSSTDLCNSRLAVPLMGLESMIRVAPSILKYLSGEEQHIASKSHTECNINTIYYSYI